MNGSEPFIHPFRTMNGYYIFDVNSNKIINASQDVYDYLSGKTAEISEPVAFEIKRMKDNGFLSHGKVKEIMHPISRNIKDILDSALEKITLQVTQQCNLRCEYCIYSGDSGNYLNRAHNSKKMSFETAKKGIDFLIQNSQDSNMLNVSFYGGEPFLEFELIQKCIGYAKEKANGKGYIIQYNNKRNASDRGNYGFYFKKQYKSGSEP